MQVSFYSNQDPFLLELIEKDREKERKVQEERLEALSNALNIEAKDIAIDNEKALIANFSRRQARKAMRKGFVSGVGAFKPGTIVKMTDGTRYRTNDQGKWEKLPV